MNIEEVINQQINDSSILLYMKGTPPAPECGFSQKVVQVLNACGEPYSFVNILENPEIRKTLPSISDWPTFPQLFINGELIGGSDIVTELHINGDQIRLLINKMNAAESLEYDRQVAIDADQMKTYECLVCGFIYDEEEGWPDDGIEPGTKWEDVPEDWVCPDCGVGKEDFEMIEI